MDGWTHDVMHRETQTATPPPPPASSFLGLHRVLPPSNRNGGGIASESLLPGRDLSTQGPRDGQGGGHRWPSGFGA
eukprot:998467-Pleurochrysis_carterae.AAC.1